MSKMTEDLRLEASYLQPYQLQQMATLEETILEKYKGQMAELQGKMDRTKQRLRIIQRELKTRPSHDK